MRAVSHAAQAWVVIVVSLLAIAVQVIPVPVLVRAPLVALFLFTVPGWSLTWFYQLRDGWLGAGLAVGISLALATLLATAQLYLSLWSVPLTVAILAAISIGSVLLAGRTRDGWLRADRPSSPESPP